MTNYQPVWQPPDPPEDPEPTPAVTCPYCGAEDALLVSTYNTPAGITQQYECCDCDHSWVTHTSHDDDDIPF